MPSSMPSLYTFTEEEEMLRDVGALTISFFHSFSNAPADLWVSFTVKKFAQEVVAPRVSQMDEAELMDPFIIKSLFDQGVSIFSASLTRASCLAMALMRVCGALASLWLLRPVLITEELELPLRRPSWPSKVRPRFSRVLPAGSLVLTITCRNYRARQG